MAASRSERIGIIVLTAFGAASALYGCVGLLTGTLETPAGTLDGTPFSSFTIPALILGVVVGGSQLVALYAGLRRESWAALAAGFAGCTMIGWIIGEILFLGSDPGVMRNLQLIYFFNGLAEAALAAVELRSQTLPYR